MISFLAHRAKNLNVLPENEDKVYDPDPGKGFTRAKLARLQEIKKSQLATAPQDKLRTVSILRVVPLTDTLAHLKECGKLVFLKKISLYVCHYENVVDDLDHEVSKAVDNDVVYVSNGFVLGLVQKIFCKI